MTEYDHLTYTKNIAEKIKEIRHVDDTNIRWHRVSGLFNLEEFIQKGKKSGVQLCCKDVFSARKNWDDGRVRERQYFTYFLFQFTGKTFPEREAVKRNLRSVERKIYSKYKKDYYSDSSDAVVYGLQNLDLNTFITEELVLVGDGFLGLSVSFTNDPILEVRYDSNDWIS